MNKLVTIGVPVYKRLKFLPEVLSTVASQDYPNIELIVSDNGVNGPAVHDVVKNNYSRPNRVRQNPSTVPMSVHFNQIIHEASGDYFLLLADDDEITSNYVSELVNLMERNTQASLAMGIQETIDETGVSLERSSDRVPEILSGTDFIRAVWGTHEYGYKSLSTFLARAADLKACGGYPNFRAGRGNDDALVIKLCLNGFVTLTPKCVFRKRFYETSYGFSVSVPDLANATKDFLKFLDSDPVIRRFAHNHPSRWREAKRYLIKMIWKAYYACWVGVEGGHPPLPPPQWVKAGFALPFIPEYYKAVVHTLVRTLASSAWRRMKGRFRRRRIENEV